MAEMQNYFVVKRKFRKVFLVWKEHKFQVGDEATFLPTAHARGTGIELHTRQIISDMLTSALSTSKQKPVCNFFKM